MDKQSIEAEKRLCGALISHRYEDIAKIFIFVESTLEDIIESTSEASAEGGFEGWLEGWLENKSLVFRR